MLSSSTTMASTLATNAPIQVPQTGRTRARRGHGAGVIIRLHAAGNGYNQQAGESLLRRRQRPLSINNGRNSKALDAKQFVSNNPSISDCILRYTPKIGASAVADPEPSPETSTDASSAARLGLFYISYFWTLGIRLPYWPVWMSEVQGLTSTQIGALMGVMQIARTAAGPLVGLVADIVQAPRLLAVLLSLCCAAAFAVMTFVPSITVPVLVASACVAGALFSAIMPLGESLAVTNIAESDYGRVRLWGSLAFMAANIIGGRMLGSGGGATLIMPILITGSLLVTAASLALPRRASSSDQANDSNSDDAKPSGGNETLKEAAALATNPIYLLFILAGCCVQAGHAAYYSFGTIMLQGAGISGSVIGMLWGVGVAAEVVLFAEKRLQAALNAWQLIALGGVAAVIRWAVMSTSPSMPVLVMMQLLHGLTFGATHLGTIKFMQAAIPSEISATAYAFYSAASDGIFMAGASYAAGVLYTSAGQQGSYLAMSALGAAGAVAAIMLGRAWGGQQLKLKPS